MSALKVTDYHGKQRRRVKGGAAKTPPSSTDKDKAHPPDKRKLDRDLADNSKNIQEKEASLKLISWNPTQELNAELSRMTAELAEIEKERKASTIEVGNMEEEIKNLGAEITKMRDEASKLVAGVRHKTEERIDEAVSKLELQLQIRKYSATEERKLQHEIDSLKKSKDRLKAYLQMKSEIDQMRVKQDKLRKTRDSLYRSKTDLREKESSLKDNMAEKKALRDGLKEERKEALARKDAIEKEIRDLQQQRRQLHEDFRQKQFVYSQATSVERAQRDEEERRQTEDRRAERRARQRKQAIELEMMRELQYDEEKAVCKALIDYVHRLSINSTVPANVSEDSPSTSVDSPPLTEPSAAAITADKPGEFLRRKESSEVLVPATTRKRSRRDKKRHTISGKVGKRLNHNATTFKQFSFIGLAPPTSHSDIYHVISQLQEKLTFYVSKSQSGFMAGSEAGDSGVGSAACSEFHDFSDPELHPSLTTSQEDPIFSISPRRSLTDNETTLKPSTPERSLTDEAGSKSTSPQPLISCGQGLLSVVSHPSSNSLATQSSCNSASSSFVVLATTNGSEE